VPEIENQKHSHFFVVNLKYVTTHLRFHRRFLVALLAHEEFAAGARVNSRVEQRRQE
jgi:hypothetical protein